MAQYITVDITSNKYEIETIKKELVEIGFDEVDYKLIAEDEHIYAIYLTVNGDDVSLSESQIIDLFEHLGYEVGNFESEVA